MNHSNRDIADLLRSVGTALTLKKRNPFEVKAYGNAADAIEHSTAEVKDLWEEGKLDQIPGVGKTIQAALNDLFKHGDSKHFDTLMDGIPKVVFELIKVPGIGPKTASEFADLGIKSISDLQSEIKNGKLVHKGFSAKMAERIAGGILEHESLQTGRMLLPYATTQAEQIIAYLKKSPDVLEVDPLGSLRRQVATIGDLDFAASSKSPSKVVEYFTKMPGVKEVIEKGEDKSMVLLNSGIHADILVGFPENYGALLQHFTGSKHHNIKLRTYALKHNLSLSDKGVKNIKTGKVVNIKKESELYEMLKMDTPDPEIREDNGEIEAALAHKLPKLVTLNDIKGDLHLHSNFPFKNPSHGPGANPLKEIVEKAKSLGYEYVGLSDHPSGHKMASQEQMVKEIEARTKEIEHIKSSERTIKVLNGLEIDILPDGTLSVLNELLANLDYVIAGIHSGHRQTTKEQMTKRILAALSNPHVDIISHPTGRILNERESYEADWDAIFKYAAKHHKLLEINSFYNRLDLRDDLVKSALEFGVKFVIDTDAHEISQMDNMRFGVSVARRGWAQSKDIVNTWEWKKFAEWFNIKAESGKR